MVKDILSYGIGTLAAFLLLGALLFVFIRDVTQKKHSVLRNYPIVGRLRYFFEQMGAFSRDEATGTYRVEFDKMQDAVNALSAKILILQGDGDYEGASQFVGQRGKIGSQLQADLDRLESANIPVDVVFEQGL